MTESFAERLKALRTDRSLTPTELAAKVGRSEQSVHLYERGSVVPPMEIIYLLADALDVSVTELVNDGVRLDNEESS